MKIYKIMINFKLIKIFKYNNINNMIKFIFNKLNNNSFNNKKNLGLGKIVFN